MTMILFCKNLFHACYTYISHDFLADISFSEFVVVHYFVVMMIKYVCGYIVNHGNFFKGCLVVP